MHTQSDLFGNLPKPKTRNKLSEAEREKRKEKVEAHRAFKFLKSNKFHEFSIRDTHLLKKHYGIKIYT